MMPTPGTSAATPSATVSARLSLTRAMISFTPQGLARKLREVLDAG